MSTISSIKQTPIASLTTLIQNLGTTISTNYTTFTYVDQKVADLVGNAPAVLDTLRELSASLGDNPNLLGTLTSTINVEVQRASAAEQGLENRISTVVTSSINAEIARALAAEQGLSTAITTSINAEIARATAVEQGLSTTITSTINAEIARASAAEQGLSTVLRSTLQSEINRAVTSEQSLSTLLATEIGRSQTAENNLTSTIIGEKGAIYNGYQSTFIGLGSAGYVSSSQLVSTTVALQGALDSLASGVNSANATISQINTSTIDAGRVNAGSLYIYTGTSSSEISTILTTQVNNTYSDIWLAGGFRYKLGNGTSVLNQSTQNIRYSVDGSNWSAIESISSFNASINGRPLKVKYLSTGLFGLSHQEGFYTSADGKNWLKRGSIPTTLTFMKDFSYADGLLVGVGASKANKTGSIVWSSNFGQTWNNNATGGFNIPGNAYFYQNDASIVRDDLTNIWVTGGQGNWAGSVAPLQYSADGSNWTNATFTSTMTSTIPYINDIAMNGSGLFVAVGDMGIMWSANGTSWTPATGTTTTTASAVAYSPTLNRWVYVGSGVIRTSSDGKSWAATNYARGSQILWDVKWTKDRFIAAGQSSNVIDVNALQTDTLLQSFDGYTWTPAITNIDDAFSAAYSGGALTVAYGQQVTQTSTIVSSISTLGGGVGVLSDSIKISTDSSGTILYLNNSSITQSYALQTSLASTASALQTELREGLTSTATYVDTRVSSIITNAPALLDTLGEIAASLSQDPAAFVHLSSTITSARADISTLQSSTDSGSGDLKTHGLQSYYDATTSIAYRTKYVGPYSPSDFSTLYSALSTNAYEHLSVKGAQTFLRPAINDTVTHLPNYSRRWIRAGTLDLTNATAQSPLNISTFANTYSAIEAANPGKIPYYDVYISPSKFYGSDTNYGYISYGSNGASQINSGHVIIAGQSTLYSSLSTSASALDPVATWFTTYKDAIPELEKTIEIVNANPIGSEEVNLFVSSMSATYEMAPGDKMKFLYTHNGWIMF